MKIIFLTNFYPPASFGGYDQLCQEVCDSLRDRGHDVNVLTSDYSPPHLCEPDPPWVHRKLHLEMELVSSRNALDFFTKRKSREAENLDQFSQIIQNFSPDVVLVWGMWNLHYSLPALAEKMVPGRVVYYICDYWPSLPNQFENYWNASPQTRVSGILKHILKPFALYILHRENRPCLNLEHAICCSHHVRTTLMEAGLLPSHSGVIYNGIDPAPLINISHFKQKHAASSNDRLKLLYFGRLNHDKGVHTAVRALGLLKDRELFANLDLTILGSGEQAYESRLRNMADDLGLREKISFIPHIGRDAIPEFLSRFDVFLFTSIWPEPMARSVMEAMAARLLVIGSKVGGQMEMLHHEQNALTFEPGDYKALSDLILRAFHDPTLRFQLAQEGQTTVLKRFTFDRMVNEVEELLQEIAIGSTSI